MCWTGGGAQEGLTGNLFLVGLSTVWKDDDDERGEKKLKCKQMAEVQTRKRMNKIDSGRE